ncbi:MAG TPA: alpha/beta fold hydrolase [Candidatus Dormibacteraeota bacterium]|nr:alpha/beta fold hydrolase [Candidatus Dormibacteraeota bacterium]
MRRPDRVSALVLMVPSAPGPGPMAPPKFIMRALFRLRDVVPGDLLSVEPNNRAKGFKVNTDDRAEISQRIGTMLPATPRRDAFLFDMFASTPTIHSGYRFGDIFVPTMVVTAADDPLAFAENAWRLAAALPASRLLEVERGGHLLLGQAEVVGGQVKRFIREHAGAPA